MRTRNWDSLLIDVPKISIDHVCDLLKPNALKLKIENDLQLSRRDLRKDWRSFYRYVVEQALVCEYFVPPRRQPNNIFRPSAFLHSHTSRQSGQSIAPTDCKPGAFVITSTPRPRNRLSPYVPPPVARVHAPARAPDATVFTASAPPCLNSTEFQGFYFLKNCTKTSYIRKKELLKSFHDAHRSKGSIRSFSRRNVPSSPPTASNRSFQAGSGRYSLWYTCLPPDHSETGG